MFAIDESIWYNFKKVKQLAVELDTAFSLKHETEAS